MRALAVTALLTALCGCQPQVSGPSSVTTEPPVSADSTSVSGGEDHETDISSGEDHVPDISSEENHVPDESSVPETTEYSDSVSESETEPDPQESSETSSEETSEPVASESTESSESSSEPPVSTSSEPPASSSSEPDPPPVVIPDVRVPTSPGTQLITGTSGIIDCSNASLGYVSAKYTGSSSKLKFRVEANGQTENYDLTADGSTEYFPLTFGDGTYTLTVFEQLPGSDKYGFAAQGTAEVQLSSPLSPYLFPNRYVSYGQNSDCVYKAAELCAGKTEDIDKIAAIFSWVAENISYDYELSTTVKAGYTPDPDRTLSRRAGICFDYASLMAAMLRSQSIPTRLVIGNAYPDIYHAWNEVYTEQTGWITPELMFKNAGYNLADATFYSTSPDKAQIAAYISDSGNYTATKYR